MSCLWYVFKGGLWFKGTSFILDGEKARERYFICENKVHIVQSLLTPNAVISVMASVLFTFFTAVSVSVSYENIKTLMMAIMNRRSV